MGLNFVPLSLDLQRAYADRLAGPYSAIRLAARTAMQVAGPRIAPAHREQGCAQIPQ